MTIASALLLRIALAVGILSPISGEGCGGSAGAVSCAARRPAKADNSLLQISRREQLQVTRAVELKGHIKNRHGICLDASQRNVIGKTVHMWTCLGINQTDHQNQAWEYDPSMGQIKNKFGICLDANSGGRVHMWTCDVEDENQRWAYDAKTGLIKNQQSLCLDSPARGVNGGDVHMWACDASNPNQQWQFDDYSCRTAVQGEDCYAAVTWAMTYGIRSNPEWYPGLTVSSSFEAFQTLFYDRAINSAVCPTLPCEEMCHTSQPGEECYPHIVWAMDVGILANPAWYPGLTAVSSFEDFQTFLHKISAECPLPCVAGPELTSTIEPTPAPMPAPTPAPTPVTAEPTPAPMQAPTPAPASVPMPGSFSIRFINDLPSASPCVHGGNSIRIFGPPGQHNIAAGSAMTLTYDWNTGCGIGIQINNWYWTLSQPMHAQVQDVDGRGMQNPDNSGINFQIDSNCKISGETNPCYGFGVRTDLVSDISSAMVGNQCTITVKKNSWTDAVTFDGTNACCAPPWAGGGACKSTNGFRTALDDKVAWPEWLLNIAKPL